MRAWTVTLLLVSFLALRVDAQELRLAIERQPDRTFRLSVLNPATPKANTFIEFSTNGVWYPAFFTSSNSYNTPVYPATNAGGIRLFRVAQGPTMARVVAASWQRLGVTNYVFDYTERCLCAGISATVTVVSNQVVKVENVRNPQGVPVQNPSLYGFRISDLFDTWISTEPNGGVASDLVFDANGFPTFISIDPDPRAADEEIIYDINSFAPLR